MSRFISAFIFSVVIGFLGLGINPVMAIDDILPPPASVFNPIHPASNKVIITPAEYVKNFQWESIDNADWYHIIIMKGDQVQFEKWYEGSAVCAEGVCTTSDDIWLAGPGQYTWWLTYWNESIGDGYVNLYKKSNFTISIPLPNAPTSTETLNGDITDTTPNLNWHNGSNAMWYEVWVGPANYSSTKYTGWHERIDVCSTEFDLCGVVMPNALSTGDYEFWARSWNPSGTSSWVKLAEFSVVLGEISN